MPIARILIYVPMTITPVPRRKITRFFRDLRLNIVLESVSQFTAVSMIVGMMMMMGTTVKQETRVTKRSSQGTRAATPTEKDEVEVF